MNKLLYTKKITLLIFMIIFHIFSSETKVPDINSQSDEPVYDLYTDTLSQNPLAPPNTSSPRATTVTFLKCMNRLQALITEAVRLQKGKGEKSKNEIRDLEKRAEQHISRAFMCLNMDEVPRAHRRSLSYESALMLKEVLDRITLPALTEIPDEKYIQALKDKKNGHQLEEWEIPQTSINLLRVTGGPRKGDYLFSPHTIKQLPHFYNMVQALPYKQERLISEDYYKFYIKTPGSLMPPRWSSFMPSWSNRLYLSQTIWQWVLLLLSFVITLRAIFFLNKKMFKEKDELLYHVFLWRRVIQGIMMGIIVYLFFRFTADYVNISGNVLYIIRLLMTLILWSLGALTTLRICTATAETLVSSNKDNPAGEHAAYIKAFFGVAGFTLMAAVMVFGLSEVGISLYPLLAGVGIGGLAIALAARPTIENVLGCFVIFWDNPFRVGDRIKVLGYDGTVEGIGLRSTTLRLRTGHLTSIPNERVIAAEIENVGRRPFIRRDLNLTLTYDTTPQNLNRAIEIVYDILSVKEDKSGVEDPNMIINHPKYQPKVFFNDFNTDSLNIRVNYWYQSTEYWKYLKHGENINSEILRRFNEENIEFAFPTQTIHMADSIQ